MRSVQLRRRRHHWPTQHHGVQQSHQEQARVRPLTEVRDDVEATLKGVERERLRKKWINKLRSKAFVRYF